MATEPVFAPELPGDLPWVNVHRGPRLRPDLLGHVVVLAFWNAGDVHGRHLMPVLAREAERSRGRAICVLGVHAPKFPAESGVDAARRAARELGVPFPVAADDDLAVWRAYGCSAWPTLVLVDAVGQIRFRGAGEVEAERLARAVDALWSEAEQSGCLAAVLYRAAPAGPPSEPPSPAGAVAPTKLAVDEARGWLWIADTAHHRVLAADLESGAVQLVAGTGQPGAADGAMGEATFAEPRGLAVVEDTVWVADSGRHLVRAIALRDEQVRTVVGQGRRVVDGHGGACGREQGLASPWDLCWCGGELYVAMAGAHQIWSLDPLTAVAVPLAGTGRPALGDGAAAAAAFAQPAGIAARGDVLGVADAQSSALRLLDLAEGHVETAVGQGLLAFGDADGPWAEARLQYPTDVAAAGEAWIVADTYNDKVKRVDARARTVETLLGPESGLRAPEGVAVRGGTVFVADTGRRRILRVDLASRAVDELVLRGLG